MPPIDTPQFIAELSIGAWPGLGMPRPGLAEVELVDGAVRQFALSRLADRLAAVARAQGTPYGLVDRIGNEMHRAVHEH